jgi:hypothetical protein
MTDPGMAGDRETQTRPRSRRCQSTLLPGSPPLRGVERSCAPRATQPSNMGHVNSFRCQVGWSVAPTAPHGLRRPHRGGADRRGALVRRRSASEECHCSPAKRAGVRLGPSSAPFTKPGRPTAPHRHAWHAVTRMVRFLRTCVTAGVGTRCASAQGERS